jgi:hypothetical protein
MYFVMENRVGGLASFHNKSVSLFTTWRRSPLFFINGRMVEAMFSC